MTALRFAGGPGLAVLLSLAAACGDNAADDPPSKIDEDPASDDAHDTHAADAGLVHRDAGRSATDETDTASSVSDPKPSDAGSRSDATITTVAVDAAAADATPGPVAAGGASCLDGITDFENAGPFQFEQKTSGVIKFWVPKVPAGCKVPVVHLANGTTANCGNYQGALERLASHGFLTACYEDPNTGAGAYGLMAIDAAFSMFPDLADHKIGSTGHSQGGQAALVTLELAEAKYGDQMTYAGLAMEPASGYGTQPVGASWQSVYAKIKSPVFMFSGDSSTGFASSSLVGISTGDGLVAISWVQEGYDALSKSVEAYHWTAIGATHIPTPVGPEQQVSIPWFRWKLLGDGLACQFFKKMADGKAWKSQQEQNVASCP